MKEPMFGRQFPKSNNWQSSVCTSWYAVLKERCAIAIWKLPENSSGVLNLLGSMWSVLWCGSATYFL